MALTYNSKLPIADFYNDVHSALKIKYGQNNKNYEKDVKDAEYIETFLTDFKKFSRNGKKNNKGFDSLRAQALNVLWDKMSQASGQKWLTQRDFLRHTGSEGGFDFEKELASIFEALALSVVSEKSARQMNLRFDENEEIYLTGAKNVKTITNRLDFQKMLNHVNEAERKYFIDAFDERFKNKYYETGGKIQYYVQDAKNMKTDIRMGENETFWQAAIIESPSEQLITLFNKVKGKQFSLKSYGGASLEIGNTVLIRAYFGVMQELGLKQYGKIAGSLAHTYNSYYDKGKSPDSPAAIGIYRVRFAYELTGAGQKDVNGKPVLGVDYLVFNKNNADNIYVRSVKELIWNIIGTDNNNNPLFTRIRVKDPFTSAIRIPISKFKAER